MHLPIRARLTLVSAVLMAVVIAALGVFVYTRLQADILAAVDDRLRDRAQNLVRDAGDGPIVPNPWTADPGDAFVQVYAADGRLLESSPDVAAGPLLVSEQLGGLTSGRPMGAHVTTTEETVPARMLVVPLARGGALLVGTAVQDEQETLSKLGPLLLIGGPLATVLASVVGWLVAGAALRPVERMRIEAEAISGADLDRRLIVPRSGDELSRLGDSLNGMIGRLKTTIVRERRFVDDASHELRTPLANLRAELDLALSRPRSTNELELALRSAAEEAERLSDLAEDLLVLARADGGRLPVRRERQAVGPLIRETVRSFTGRAAALSVTLVVDVDEIVEARVDTVRIRQALSNLIDNALRHTPPGGRVSVADSIRDGILSVTVADSGPGFAADFLGRAFESFSRADAARGRAQGGTGLGLSIVRVIVLAHGGSVEARNGPDGGAIVEMRIPV